MAQDIKKGTDFIMRQFRNCQPGEIIMLQTLKSAYRNNRELSEKFFSLNLNILLYNEYLKQKHRILIGPTERGYSLLQGEETLFLNINIFKLIPECKDRKKFFYHLWDIIGIETAETNPFYIKGSSFYNVIKEFLQGLPPTVSLYLANVKEKEKREKSRSEWYLDLFQTLEDSQVEPFLNKLSALINERNKIALKEDGLNMDDSLISEMMDNDLQITNNTSMKETKIQKTPKVFISHKTEDDEYAKALVDLILSLGVKSEDIFCSSYPPFAIKFGDNILEIIKKQFEEHNLFVLFIHSPRYYKSAISLNEMGAAWILKSDHLSFLTNDCSFDMLTGVIDSKETAFKAGDSRTEHLLFDFKDKIIDFFKLEKMDEKLWDTRKKEFLEKVNNLHCK